MIKEGVFSLDNLSEMLHGHEYGRFMRRLCEPSGHLCKQDINACTSGLGLDLDALSYILCCVTPVQIKEIKKLCSSKEGKEGGTDGNFDLIERINSKLKNDSLEYLFFKGVLDSERKNDDKEKVDENTDYLEEASKKKDLHGFVSLT